MNIVAILAIASTRNQTEHRLRGPIIFVARSSISDSKRLMDLCRRKKITFGAMASHGLLDLAVDEREAIRVVRLLRSTVGAGWQGTVISDLELRKAIEEAR